MSCIYIVACANKIGIVSNAFVSFCWGDIWMKRGHSIMSGPMSHIFCHCCRYTAVLIITGSGAYKLLFQLNRLPETVFSQIPIYFGIGIRINRRQNYFRIYFANYYVYSDIFNKIFISWMGLILDLWLLQAAQAHRHYQSAANSTWSCWF
jgi:hypothetical protein